jgi:hypothetical protein
MQEDMSAQDLKERVELIEAMIADGRRRTESWGWVFVLWGVAYYVAIGWATWGHGVSVWGVGSSLAWPVTMLVAFIATWIIGLSKGKGQPSTSIGRAIVAIWMSIGVSMLLLFPGLAMMGRLDQHAFVAIIAAMLGTANGATGFVLRWKAEIACAIVWWATAAGACFGSITWVGSIFLAAIFLCQIVFGIYAMILEARRNRPGTVVHA